MACRRDFIAVSNQFFRGDEGNDDLPLAGYAVVNLRTGYRVNDNVELYGIVKNLFSTDYATFGTYFDTEALRTVGGTPVGAGPRRHGAGEPAHRSRRAPPLAVYGGLKVRF